MVSITRPPGPSIAASDTTYNTGTVVLSGGANITVGTNGQTITIAGGGGGAGAFTAGMSNLGNTSGTTGVADRRLLLVGGNNVTLSQSLDAANSSGTITISVPNTSSQTGTQFSGGISGGNTSGNTGTKPGMMVLAGGNNITVSGSTNGDTISVTISGGAGAGGFAGGGISGGNTSGDTGSVTGRLIFAGGNNITLSGSTNAGSMTITVSAGAGGAETQTAISGIGASDTTYTSGTVIISGQANITVNSSVNGASQYVRLSGNAAQTGTQFSGGISNLGNTAGDTGVKAAQLVLVGTDNITLSGSTNGESATVSVKAAAGGGDITHSFWDPYMGDVAVAGVQGQGTLYLQPHKVPNVQYDRFVMPIHYSQATNSTLTVTVSAWAGIYTRNASTLSLAHSSSTTQSINGSGTASSNQNSGIRLLTMGWTTTLSESDYWVGIISRTTTAGANASLSQMLASNIGSAWSGLLGVASNATNQRILGQGMFSATTAAMPNSVAFTDIQGSNSRDIRPPMFYLHSVTI